MCVLCELPIRWLTGRHLVSVVVTEPRAPSGLVHKALTPSVTMTRMGATWSLRFMAGVFNCLVLFCFETSNVYTDML